MVHVRSEVNHTLHAGRGRQAKGRSTFLPFAAVCVWGGGGEGGWAAARTGIFFWVTTTTLSLPLTPIDVTPTDLIALNAYSATGRGTMKQERHSSVAKG